MLCCAVLSWERAGAANSDNTISAAADADSSSSSSSGSSGGVDNALHVACRFGHTRLAQLLLDAGYSPNARGSNGSTPLLLAAMGGAATVSPAAAAAMRDEQQQQESPGVTHPVTLAAAADMRPCLALSMAAAAGRQNASLAAAAAAAGSGGKAAKSSTAVAAAAAAPAAAAPAPVACAGCGRQHIPLPRQQQQQQCVSTSSSSSSSSSSIDSSRSLLCMVLMAAGADDQAVDASGVSVAMAAASCGLTWLVETSLHESTGALAAAAAAVLQRGFSKPATLHQQQLNPGTAATSSSTGGQGLAGQQEVDPAVLAAAAAAPVRAGVAAAVDQAGWTVLHWAAANGHEGGWCLFFLGLLCVEGRSCGLVAAGGRGRMGCAALVGCKWARRWVACCLLCAYSVFFVVGGVCLSVVEQSGFGCFACSPPCVQVTPSAHNILNLYLLFYP
jgi:ankyrin repeat protein